MSLVTHAASPVRHKPERTIKGVSNLATLEAKPRRLCQLPNPKATVLQQTIPDMHNPRNIDNALYESRVVHAPEHRAYSKPPPLPSALQLLGTIKQVPPDVHLTNKHNIVCGIPGLVKVASQSEDVLRLPQASDGIPVIRTTSPRKKSSTCGMSQQSSHTCSEVNLAPTPKRLTAAEIFLQGGASIIGKSPDLKSPVNPTEGRSGSTKRPDTYWLTQPQPGTALYSEPSTRFDANTRGLGCGLVAQQDKLKAQVASEIKTVTRRRKEAEVIASRTADGERQLRIEEGRIRSKALQKAGYNERMAQYKYTS